MPGAVVKTLAQKAGKSVNEVEKLWKEIKKDLLKSYSTTDPKFYGTLVLILKRKLKIVDSDLMILRRKQLSDFSRKTVYNIKELNVVLMKQLKSILQKSDVMTGFFSEYKYKSSDGVVVIGAKGGVEFWIYHKGVDYVKKANFRSEGELIKMIKEEAPKIVKFQKENNPNYIESKDYAVADSSFPLSDIVTSEVISGPTGNYINAEPGPIGTPLIMLKKKIVCINKKCRFVMPKNPFIEQMKSLSCPVCGSPMK